MIPFREERVQNDFAEKIRAPENAESPGIRSVYE